MNKIEIKRRRCVLRVRVFGVVGATRIAPEPKIHDNARLMGGNPSRLRWRRSMRRRNGGRSFPGPRCSVAVRLLSAALRKGSGNIGQEKWVVLYRGRFCGAVQSGERYICIRKYIDIGVEDGARLEGSNAGKCANPGMNPRWAVSDG